MMFAHSWALLLLAVPVVLLLWEWGWRQDRTPFPIDHALHRKRHALGFGLRVAAGLPALLLANGVLLLAGPQRMSDARDERELTNIEICLDVSGSMGWPISTGANQVRYEVAMDAISRFTQARKGDACGLTIFGGETVRWTPLTRDLDAIRLATPFLDPKTQPAHMRSTRIGGALRACLATLTQQEEGDRMIVLISDGQSSDLGGGAAGEIGRELRDADISLFAIHIGDGEAPAQLSEVVGPTGGAVFAAHNRPALQQVFDEIDSMKLSKLKPSAPKPVDWYRPFALAGFLLLGLHLLAQFGLRYLPW
jgi:Ca-activated chloride channel homolog